MEIQCDDKDLFNNYLALWVAITHGATNSESAFELTDKLLDRPFAALPKHPPKLTKDDVRYIVRLRNRGISVTAIGRIYGRRTSTISKMISRATAGEVVQ